MKIQTTAVHAGDRKKPGKYIPVATPIHTASSYFYETMEQLDRIFGEEEAGYCYSRYDSPTAAALEELMTALELLGAFDGVFDVLKPAIESGRISDAEVDSMIEQRTAAKKARDFARADRIRDELLERGIILEDTKSGVRWKRKSS